MSRPPGGRWAVDTGFIVFNERNYPNFERMLAELGVPSQPTNMSFSVSDGRGRFEWATRSPRAVFARPGHALDPKFHRMLLDLTRFNRDARRLVGRRADGPSLRRFLADGGYSEYFIERLLVPQASAIWSADPRQMWSFPAGFLAEFFDNHGVLQFRDRPAWRTVSGGSRRYVEALIAPFRDRVHLRSPGAPDPPRSRLGERRPRRLERALRRRRACGPLRSGAAACSPTPPGRSAEVLGAIPYQRNEAVLHTDAGVMPRRRFAWASWNYHLADEPSGRTTVTYDMNRLQSLGADRGFFVTLNRTEAIDSAAVIRTIDYAHPVFTPAGVAAQDRWAEISGATRTHYCGAYWRWGFHEDGVWSALRVSRALGGRGPLARHGERAAARRRPRRGSEGAGGGRMSASAIYEGWVAHRRLAPVPHSFRYRIFMPLLDLDELPEVLDPIPLWSARRPAPAWFRRRDYLGDLVLPPRRGSARPGTGPRRAPAGGPREAARQPPLPRRRLQPGLASSSSTARMGMRSSP